MGGLSGDEEEQERPKVTKSHIPTFKAIEEEAAFWDARSIEEFAHELTPVENVKFVKARSRLSTRSQGDHLLH